MTLLRFVESIDASPVVRLDLNDSAPFTMGAETRFDPPGRAGEPESDLLTSRVRVNLAGYGARILRLHLIVGGASHDDLAAALSDLWRELDQPGLLQYQPGTLPVFFRSLGVWSADSDLSRIFDTGELRLDVAAEPFGLGLAVTQGPHTVFYDPAAAENPCYLDVAGVSGDVPTPALVVIDDAGAFLQASIVSTRRRGDAFPTLFRQAEGMTLGTDTTSTADANASGGNAAWVNFATQTAMVARLTGELPVASPTGAAYRGTYRVFVRAAITSGEASVRLKQPITTTYNTAVSVTGSSYRWYDLGLFRLPRGHDPVTPGYRGVEASIALSGLLLPAVEASRVSGAGTLKLDATFNVFADEDYAVMPAVAAGGTADVVYDGPADDVYPALDPLGSPAVYANNQTSHLGGMPHLRPGDTRLVLLFEFESPATLAFTRSVSVSYWPRYLYAPAPPPEMTVLAGLDIWLRARDVTGIADGAGFTTWPARSPATDPATTTGFMYPIFRATGGPNGGPAAEFDGVDDEMAMTLSAAAKPVTIFSVCRFTGQAAIIAASTAGGLQYNAGASATKQGVTSIGVATDQQDVGQWAIAAFTYSASGVWAHYLGTLGANGSGTNNQTFSASTVRLARGDASEFYAGKATELMRWTRVLTDAELDIVGEYLAYEHRLPWASV